MKEFKDPIAPRHKWSSRDFAAPSKEKATTGRFMPPGDDYGVGFRTPVGKFVASGMEQGPIPQKCKAFSAENVPNV